MQLRDVIRETWDGSVHGDVANVFQNRAESLANESIFGLVSLE
jgi:hypothetical protein